jgi:hypothetical protein
MTAPLAYAKTFGPAYGKAPPAKLHRTADGEFTLCGLACYAPGKDGDRPPWIDVCKRCQLIDTRSVSTAH